MDGNDGQAHAELQQLKRSFKRDGNNVPHLERLILRVGVSSDLLIRRFGYWKKCPHCPQAFLVPESFSGVATCHTVDLCKEPMDMQQFFAQNKPYPLRAAHGRNGTFASMHGRHDSCCVEDPEVTADQTQPEEGANDETVTSMRSLKHLMMSSEELRAFEELGLLVHFEDLEILQPLVTNQSFYDSEVPNTKRRESAKSLFEHGLDCHIKVWGTPTLVAESFCDGLLEKL